MYVSPSLAIFAFAHNRQIKHCIGFYTNFLIFWLVSSFEKVFQFRPMHVAIRQLLIGSVAATSSSQLNKEHLLRVLKRSEGGFASDLSRLKIALKFFRFCPKRRFSDPKIVNNVVFSNISCMRCLPVGFPKLAGCSDIFARISNCNLKFPMWLSLVGFFFRIETAPAWCRLLVILERIWRKCLQIRCENVVVCNFKWREIEIYFLEIWRGASNFDSSDMGNSNFQRQVWRIHNADDYNTILIFIN